MFGQFWREGYDEVLNAITEMREVRECPYPEGSSASEAWFDGVSAAWDDECKPIYLGLDS